MNKIYWKALFPAFVFLLMQVVFSFLVPLVMLVCHPSAMKDIVAKGPASIDHSAFVSPGKHAEHGFPRCYACQQQYGCTDGYCYYAGRPGHMLHSVAQGDGPPA